MSSWKPLKKTPPIKVGDLVRKVGLHYTGAEPGSTGVVIETGINMWGEEMIPAGVEILWGDTGEISVEYEDEVEVV